MRHLGLEIHRLEKMMARRRGYSAAHQDADRLTGMHGYLIRYLYENRGRDVFQRVRFVFQEFSKRGKEISVCGEMAASWQCRSPWTF